MHLAADGMSDVVLDDAVGPTGPLPRRVDRVLDRRTDVVQWCPTASAAAPAHSEVLRRRDGSRGPPGRPAPAADDDRDCRVAVPALVDRAAVHREQVALGQHPGAGDPCTTSSLTEVHKVCRYPGTSGRTAGRPRRGSGSSARASRAPVVIPGGLRRPRGRGHGNDQARCAHEEDLAALARGTPPTEHLSGRWRRRGPPRCGRSPRRPRPCRRPGRGSPVAVLRCQGCGLLW